VPYAGFLWRASRAPAVPRLSLAGFWSLLAFVGATVAAGGFAHEYLGASLEEVDRVPLPLDLGLPLSIDGFHALVQSLLLGTNVLIALGFQGAVEAAGAGTGASGGVGAAGGTTGAGVGVAEGGGGEGGSGAAAATRAGGGGGGRHAGRVLGGGRRPPEAAGARAALLPESR